MANEPDDTDGRTVQMSADQLARLHRELGILAEDGAEAKPPEAKKPAGAISRTAATAEPPAVSPRRAVMPEPEPEPEDVYEDEPMVELESEPAMVELEPEPTYDAEPLAPEPAPIAKGKVKPEPKPEVKAKPEPKPKVEKAPKPLNVRPAPVAVAESGAYVDGGGGMTVMGGIGAILIALATIYALLQRGLAVDLGLGVEVDQIIYGFVAGAGWILLMLGLFGAARATNGLAMLVGVFALISGVLYVFLGVSYFAGILNDMADLVEIITLLHALIPATALLLAGIWGLSAGRGMGTALAAIFGIFATLAGAAYLTVSILALGRIALDGDILQIIDIVAPSLTAGAMLILAIAMFGPLTRGVSADA